MLVACCELDLGVHEWCDLTCHRTFATLDVAVREGLIDALFGGPPCATWSKLRYTTNSPPPLRARGALCLGFTHLTIAQHSRVKIANNCAHSGISR